ncbi:GrpB protein [uncultured archaeon]|nr:GrpB protein [uncultured archaeon]
MVESHFEHWERLLFWDYLTAHPDVSREYQRLKMRLAAEYQNDRVAYTKGKTAFIMRGDGNGKKDRQKAQQTEAKDG